MDGSPNYRNRSMQFFFALTVKMVFCTFVYMKPQKNTQMKRHNHILKSVLIALSAFFILSVKPSLAQKDQASTKAELEYAIGADFSFLKAAEDDGTVFRDNKVAKPGLESFRDHCYNWIRLRLFHSPDRLPNDLD